MSFGLVSSVAKAQTMRSLPRGFYKGTTGADLPSSPKHAYQVYGLHLLDEEEGACGDGYACSTSKMNLLTAPDEEGKPKYSPYAAKVLMTFAGWSYSDYDTFVDMVGDTVGPGVETLMIQIKNEPMIVQATAQLIRSEDKKTIVVVFRGTEMTNLVNWMTDAVCKKEKFALDCNPSPKTVEVHNGFKMNFEKVWRGQKGILKHLLHPEMLRKDYDYDKPRDQQVLKTDEYGKVVETGAFPDEFRDLEAIYICGHSLGGAMAFLGGLYSMADLHGSDKLKTKLRGVYTYGSPMVIGSNSLFAPENREKSEAICKDVTFRHVYYNDIVPHLPPLSMGAFDHVGPEYRFHPRHGWKKRNEEEGIVPSWHKGRCTQVPSILFTAPLGAIDGLIDNINWLTFWRGGCHDMPVIGFLSRGYLKMWWSFLDHSPLGYMKSLADEDMITT